MSKENPNFAIRAFAAGAAVFGGMFVGVDNNLESQQQFGAQKFSVDMDPAQNPGNTKNSLGSRQDCARINENNKLDADEDFVDGVEFDVTAVEIPQESKMIAFGFSLKYDPNNFEFTEKNINGLLSTAAGYSGFDASEPLPDSDGTTNFSVADINVAGAYGSGFLVRVNMETKPGADSENYQILLSESGHVDTNGNSWAPNMLESGQVAINSDCQQITTPNETLTPTPTVPVLIDNGTGSGPRELPATGGRP